MKIKLLTANGNEEQIKKQLESGDFKFVSDDEDFVLVCKDHKINSLIGKIGSEMFIIKPQDIIYIKADGNDSICVTESNEYYIKEKLYQIEALLFEHKFVRVSRSIIININMIRSIVPTLNLKFKLKMKNDEVVIVTRHYYYIFKDQLGI